MKNKSAAKLTAAAMAVILAAGTLAGCGSSSESADTEEAAEETTDGEEDEAETAEDEDAEETEEVEEADEAVTVYVGTAGTIPPFTYTDDDENLIGYDIDLIRAIFDEIPGYEVEIEATEFASILAGLDAGIYQIGACNFAYNEERAAKYIYSDPIFENQFVIAVRSDNDDINSWEDMAGKTTEVGSSGNYATALENWNDANPDEQVILNYSENDLANTLANVESGKYDFQLIDKTTLQTYIDEYGFDLKSIDLTEEESELIGANPYSYYLVENTEEGETLVEILNEGIAAVIENGTAAEISETYFGGNFVPEAE